MPHLLDLPNEILEQIIQFVRVLPRTRSACSGPWPLPEHFHAWVGQALLEDSQNDWSKREGLISLASTCKQLYVETLRVYYQEAPAINCQHPKTLRQKFESPLPYQKLQLIKETWLQEIWHERVTNLAHAKLCGELPHLKSITVYELQWKKRAFDYEANGLYDRQDRMIPREPLPTTSVEPPDKIAQAMRDAAIDLQFLKYVPDYRPA
ncbi:hypothetical protein NA57DRAFT_82098 [Rhizodiscina lignyota]|uniref:F-box domain-containing protein n=1 Tax=Rhizodiscina lignyota TaxID=1504668 RepID=A0A9P4I0J7_9PEZI|nr:hypothetical protein NA57DRAFT_82098 [Rhizodiscina lignyota]